MKTAIIDPRSIESSRLQISPQDVSQLQFLKTTVITWSFIVITAD